MRGLVLWLFADLILRLNNFIETIGFLLSLALIAETRSPSSTHGFTMTEGQKCPTSARPVCCPSRALWVKRMAINMQSFASG